MIQSSALYIANEFGCVPFPLERYKCSTCVSPVSQTQTPVPCSGQARKGLKEHQARQGGSGGTVLTCLGSTVTPAHVTSLFSLDGLPGSTQLSIHTTGMKRNA